MNRCYPLPVIEKLISDASDAGYTVVTVSEGVLGLGHLLLVAPAPGYWNFEITEKSLNCWSSTHSLRRFRKISQRIRDMMKGGI